MLPPNAILQGRYVILQKLGQGGFGAVYKVADQRLAGSVCAIKEMSDAALHDPAEKAQAVAAFQHEAQLLARLVHPNIPRVTDYFAESNRHYIVMEYVPGETLEDRLARQRTPCSEQEVRGWAEQLCDVLAYLHSQNPSIVFRDLKPANIMLTPQGQIKLIDFGIARLFKPGRSMDTEPLGTPGFAPPEQWGKTQTDGRSDVYSLGVVLHHLLTFYDPASTPFQLPPVRRLQPSVSVQMEQVIARATQQYMHQRYQQVSEMKQALAVGAAPAPQLQSSGTSPTVSPPAASRGVPIWALIALVVVALAAGAVIMGGILNNRGDGTVAVVTAVSPTAPPRLPEEPAGPSSEVIPAVEPIPVATDAPTDTPTMPPPTRTPTPTASRPPNTPTPDWSAYQAAITNVVDYYGSDIKIQATTYLDGSPLSEVLIEPVLERQRQSVCWLQNRAQLLHLRQSQLQCGKHRLRG
ncbi:MAG: serine/threonine-protein kinase [Anaerolineae bacterium]